MLAVADLVYVKIHGTPMHDPSGFFGARPIPL